MPDYKSALMGAMNLLDRPARALRERGFTGGPAVEALVSPFGMSGLDAEMAVDILEEFENREPAWRLMQEHQRAGLDREMERARMMETPRRNIHYTSALSSLGGQRPSAGPDPVGQRLQQYEEDSAARWQAEEARRRMAMAREATARNPYVSPFSAPRGPSHSPELRRADPTGYVSQDPLMQSIRQLEWADEGLDDVQRLEQEGSERRLLEQRLEDLRYE